MAVKNITVNSKEMKMVIGFVKKMTKTMLFDENMENADWNKNRRTNNWFYRIMPKQKGVSYKKVSLGATEALISYTRDSKEDNIILYIHGGGFVTGSAFVSKSYSSMLAKYSGYKVYAVEYALAPEFPFPHGFNNCCEAFKEICRLYPDSKITLIGESAGGNFCVALGLKYKDTGKISSVIVHSPTVDFSGAVDHSVNENKDFIVKLGCLEPLRRMYVGDNDSKNISISPLLGDFSGYPPIFISCDANETLFADSKALYEKCVSAGVEVEMCIAKNTYHAFAVSGTNTPETTTLLKDNIKFINKHLNK